MPMHAAPPFQTGVKMSKLPSRASVREQKAEALDVFVKSELVRKKALDDAQRTKLKALRVEREEQEQANGAAGGEPVAGKRAARKTMHLPRSS